MISKCLYSSTVCIELSLIKMRTTLEGAGFVGEEKKIRCAYE